MDTHSWEELLAALTVMLAMALLAYFVTWAGEVIMRHLRRWSYRDARGKLAFAALIVLVTVTLAACSLGLYAVSIHTIRNPGIVNCAPHAYWCMLDTAIARAKQANLEMWQSMLRAFI